MRITGYRREDFDRVMEINDACYTGIYCPPRQTVADMISVSDVFIAQLDNHAPEIIGFAIVKNVSQPYVWNIAVDPSCQGRGIGGNLLREVIKRYTLDHQHAISLHVNIDNPAQKLYFDYGFRVRAIEPGYFEPNDGLLMERKLP